jgi:hypothetical protein
MIDTRIIGMGQPPPGPPPPGPPPGPPLGPPPGPPPMWPMIWPQYQPSPTVYVEQQALQTEAPCKWYEDLQGSGDVVYCRAPAVWLVIAAVGAGTLWMMSRRRA